MAAVAILVPSSLARAADSTSDFSHLYPQGNIFPLGLYSADTPEDMAAIKSCGFNTVQTYTFNTDYANQATQNNVFAFGSLPPQLEPGDPKRTAPVLPTWKDSLAEYVKNQNIAWWDMPEELRHWEDNEMNLVKEYSALTRQMDGQKRPNYEYIPAHYTQSDIEQYLPYIDIVPASIYPHFSQQKHNWARWRMETTVNVIKAKAKLGPNYLAGEKTPVGIIELFNDRTIKEVSPLSAAASYHDFWQSLVSGAKGIMVYSYHYRNDSPELTASWDSICQAAKQLSGHDNLTLMILYGNDYNQLKSHITSGQDQTDDFIPAEGIPTKVRYPSLDLLAKTYNNNFYLIAINSSDQPIAADITGLPNNLSSINVLFDDQTKTLPIKNGALTVSLDRLGVRVMVAPNYSKIQVIKKIQLPQLTVPAAINRSVAELVKKVKSAGKIKKTIKKFSGRGWLSKKHPIKTRALTKRRK